MIFISSISSLPIERRKVSNRSVRVWPARVQVAMTDEGRASPSRMPRCRRRGRGERGCRRRSGSASPCARGSPPAAGALPARCRRYRSPRPLGRRRQTRDWQCAFVVTGHEREGTGLNKDLARHLRHWPAARGLLRPGDEIVAPEARTISQQRSRPSGHGARRSLVASCRGKHRLSEGSTAKQIIIRRAAGFICPPRWRGALTRKIMRRASRRPMQRQLSCPHAQDPARRRTVSRSKPKPSGEREPRLSFT